MGADGRADVLTGETAIIPDTWGEDCRRSWPNERIDDMKLDGIMEGIMIITWMKSLEMCRICPDEARG